MSETPTLYPKATAVVIRKVLRAAFPATTFRVVIGRGSMVSSVHIKWTDGPTRARVEALVAGFEAGKFDGMTDSYNYDRSAFLTIDGVVHRPGTRYVFAERSLSAAGWALVAGHVARMWGVEVPSRDAATSMRVERAGGQYFSDLVHRAASDRASVVEGR
jgi:hypothetical protein